MRMTWAGQKWLLRAEKIKTPNIDRLASEGQRWVYFYSGAPVCSPFRNVLMTGRHTGNCDVRDLKRVDASENWRNLKGDWPIRTETYTLPEAMKKADYATAVFGKWGIGDFGSTGAPDRHGVDRFYGYTDQKACHTYYPPYLWNDGSQGSSEHLPDCRHHRARLPTEGGGAGGDLPRGTAQLRPHRGQDAGIREGKGP